MKRFAYRRQRSATARIFSRTDARSSMHLRNVYCAKLNTLHSGIRKTRCTCKTLRFECDK